MTLKQKVTNYINNHQTELVYAMMFYSGNVNYKLVEDMRNEK